MAMTYTESDASIFRNEWFKSRVRVAMSRWVNYLLNADPADPEYDAKIATAQRLTAQYDIIVGQLMFTLSGDVEVQTAGPCIADEQLQAIVEKTIKKYYPTQVAPPPGRRLPTPVIHSVPPPLPTQ